MFGVGGVWCGENGDNCTWTTLKIILKFNIKYYVGIKSTNDLKSSIGKL